MNITEFMEYVKTFGKAKGEYTKDEVYEIGRTYKEIKENKISWQELSDLIGWRNGESLRTYIKSRLDKDGLLPKRVPTLDEVSLDRVVGNSTEETELSKEIETQLSNLYKEKVKYRDIMNSYRRALREEARIEVMLDAIKEGASKCSELPKVEYVNRNEFSTNFGRDTSKNEAILMVSDLHLGVECANYYNTYNSGIASKRLSYLVTNVIDYCQRNDVKKLTIANLGDSIHGLIHTSARVEQEMDVVSQTMAAGELLAQVLNLLQKAAPDVVYRSVTDNHSRAIADKHQHIEQENWCRVIDWWLKERLKDTSIKFEENEVDRGILKFNLLNGKLVVGAHGHEDKKTSVVQDMTGLLRVVPDYILLAHFHNPAEHSFQNTKVYVNGSIVGTEQYAFGKRLFTEPSQKLLIFENNIVMDIDINLNI